MFGWLRRRGLGAARAAVLAVAAPVLGAEEGAGRPEYLLVDASKKINERSIESCPLRFEIPLASWLESKPKGPWTIARTRVMAECQEATLQSVVIRRSHPAGAVSEGVSVQPWVYLPAGQDQRIGIKLSIVTAGKELAKRSDSLPGDNGESNWRDPIYLPIPTGELDAALRIEIWFAPR